MPIVEVMVGKTLYEDVVSAFGHIADDIGEGIERGLIEAKPLLLKSLRNVATRMEKEHGSPWNGQVRNPSRHLQSRSGEGLRSIRDSIRVAAENGTLIAGQISAGSLSFHETGGTIRARGGGYLTIPLPAALDPRGVPLRQRARQWDNTFVRRSRKGNLLIFRRIPGARDLTPLYILKTEVHIPARLGMTEAVDDEFGYFDQKLFEEISNTIDRTLH